MFRYFYFYWQLINYMFVWGSVKTDTQLYNPNRGINTFNHFNIYHLFVVRRSRGSLNFGFLLFFLFSYFVWREMWDCHNKYTEVIGNLWEITSLLLKCESWDQTQIKLSRHLRQLNHLTLSLNSFKFKI